MGRAQGFWVNIGAPLLMVVAMLATTVVMVGGTASEASASTCDDTIVVEADLTAAVTCYNGTGAGEVTTLTVSGPLSLTAVLPTIDNATDATLIINGGTNTITGAAGSIDMFVIVDGDVTMNDLTIDAASRHAIDIIAGELTLVGSEIRNPAEQGIRSGDFFAPGTASITLTNSSITGVVDTGIFAGVGTVVVTSSTISGSAGYSLRQTSGADISVTESVLDGGGTSNSSVSQNGAGGASALAITSSTISGFDTGASAEGTLTIADSTFVDNGQALSVHGTTTATNSTLVGRGRLMGGTAVSVNAGGSAALTGLTIVDYSSGIVGAGSLTLTGTLIARNNNGSCNTFSGLTVTDGGGNVIPSPCGPIAGTANNDDGVGVLASNACDISVATCTDTVAIDEASPAIDAWGDCSPLADDQRGVARTAGKCDAGAYEGFDCPLANVATEAALRLAIRCYNDTAAGVAITTAMTADIALGSLLPEIDNATTATLVIDGGGHQLTPPSGQDGFTVADGDLTVEDLTIAGGFNGVQVLGDGHLSVIESTISGATENALLGFGTGNTASLTVLRSTIDTNQFGVRGFGGPVSITASTIANSSSQGVGTGAGGSTIVNSTLSNNGTGIFIFAGTNTVTSTSIVHSSQRGLDTFGGSSGTTTFTDSISINNNGGCNGTVAALDAVVVDGGGNVHNGGPSANNGCGPIPVTLGVSYEALPALASNACQAGATCTQTVALPAGFPAKGAGETCVPAIDQRGITRPSADCDAGAYEADNEAPVANDDDFGSLVTEDDPATPLDVLGGFQPDTDLESTDFTVTAVSGLTAGAGTVTVDGDGLGVTYTPALNWNGDTTFTYTITDGEGGTDSALVELFVSPVNDDPVAIVDSALVIENTTGNVIDVLANDTDTDNDAGDLFVSAVTQPPNGTVVIGTGGANVEYTPDPGYLTPAAQTDVFTYTISDGNGGEDTANVSVFVQSGNTPPVGNDDVYVISIIPKMNLDVLGNDTDADGDELTIVSATQPFPIIAGSIEISADNKSIDFITRQAFTGQATFRYIMSDGENGSSVLVTVTFGAGLECDPNYVPCIPVSAADLNCSDIGVAVQVVGEDIHNLDADGDGVGCTGSGEPLLLLCNGVPVTIDMNDGASGIGTAAADVIYGTPGADVIDGGGGDDIICGGAGDDNIQGNAGNDTIFGGPGADKLFGAQGFDEIHGGAGNDTIHGNRGNDTLFGDDGDDRIFGYAHDDTISGGPGDDRLHGNFGDDVIDGGDGNDRIFGYGDQDTLNGDDGDDLITGNFGDDIIDGGSGNDVLYGADGDDTVSGGPGNDQVNGNSLNDTLHGGAGDDTLDGGIDTDTCNGNAGVDTATRCETITGVP